MIKHIFGTEGRIVKVYDTITTHRNNYGIHVITDADLLYSIYGGKIQTIFKLVEYNTKHDWVKIDKNSTTSNHNMVVKFKSDDRYCDGKRPNIIKKSTFNNRNIYLTNDGICLNAKYAERHKNVKYISYNAILFNDNTLVLADGRKIKIDEKVKQLCYNHFITEDDKIYYFGGK